MNKIIDTVTSYRHRITLRTFLLAEGFGFLFSLATVLGFCLDHYGTVTGSFAMILLELLCVIALTEPICLLNLALLFWSDNWKIREEKYNNSDSFHASKKGWKIFFFYLIVLTIAYLPVFLAYYPSVFSYDAERQMYEIISGNYSTHHPLLHTLFMRLFLVIGAKIGSYGGGMAIHSIVQMVLMNGMMAYAMYYLYKEGVRRGFRIALALLWIFMPAFSVLSISTTKDVLFSGLVLVYVLRMHSLYITLKSHKEPSLPDMILYIIIAVLMMLLRNNAVYAYVAALPILLFWMRRILTKRAVAMILVALVLSFVGSAGLKGALHAENGSPREMLSIPIQQLARVRVKCYEDMNADLQAQMDGLIGAEWCDRYKPHLADPIKERINFDNPALFVKLWAKLLVKYPGVYIDAFLDTCEGQWYLFDSSHSEIYGKGKIYGFGYLSTDMRPMPAGMEIVTESKIPALYDFMEGIVSDNLYRNIPIIRLLFAPAFYIYMMGIYCMIQWHRRNTGAFVPMAFLLTYYLTLLLSPAVLVRYFYLYMLCVPVLCLLYGQNREN